MIQDYLEQLLRSGNTSRPWLLVGSAAPPEKVATVVEEGLVGWAWDPRKPDEPIDVGVFDGDDLLLTIRCNRFGEFLARRGKGNGSTPSTYPRRKS